MNAEAIRAARPLLPRQRTQEELEYAKRRVAEMSHLRQQAASAQRGDSASSHRDDQEEYFPLNPSRSKPAQTRIPLLKRVSQAIAERLRKL